MENNNSSHRKERSGYACWSDIVVSTIILRNSLPLTILFDRISFLWQQISAQPHQCNPLCIWQQRKKGKGCKTFKCGVTQKRIFSNETYKTTLNQQIKSGGSYCKSAIQACSATVKLNVSRGKVDWPRENEINKK